MAEPSIPRTPKPVPRQAARFVGACTLAAVACDPAPPPDPAPVVRDSAGIRIVESQPSPDRPAAWVLDSIPAFRIGQAEGDPAYLLSRVVGALRLPDGRIVIGNGGSNEVRFYDTGGRFLAAHGRAGEGPGEYTYMRGLGRCRDDGFVAFDLNWQTNAYTFDGTFLERRRLATPDGRSPYNAACDEQARFVVLSWGLEIGGPLPIGFHQARGPLFRIDEDGSVVAEFGERLASERLGVPNGSRPHPFGRATVFALHGDHLFVGSGERFEVEIWHLDGTQVGMVRGPSRPLAIGDSLRSAYLAAALETTRPELHPAVRRDVAEMEWPPEHPVYTALHVDPVGIVWLRRFAVGGAHLSPERWSLLDPERGYLGDLTLPAGATLLEVGADHVLVLARDDLGVESVALHTLRRTGPRS